MNKWFLVTLISFLFTACKKNGAEEDRIQPVVTITSPANGTVYAAGDVILITGKIIDNDHIAEAHIHIINTNTSALLMDVHLYPATDSTNFNQFIVAGAGINYRIQVIAKDRAINEGRSSVEVSCP